MPDTQSVPEAAKEPLPPVVAVPEDQHVAQTAEESPTVTQEPEAKPAVGNTVVQAEISPADALFAAVREVIQRLLKAPMKDAEVAAALKVPTAQAKAWLQRLVDEGLLEKLNKPARYVVRLQGSLLSNEVHNNRVAREVALPSPHTTEPAGPHSAVQVGE